MTDSERYDRQIRLWGPHGQAAIQSATIIFLGSDCVASEFLKNMVLHGVRNVIVIDNAIVTQKDIGSNFFVDVDSFNKNRAETVAALLTELNPSSQIRAVISDPNDLNSLQPICQELNNSDIIILSSGNLSPDFLDALSDFCRSNRYKQAHIQISGYFGAFYIDGGYHHFFEGSSQSKYPNEELRILNPFPSLVEFWETIDWDNCSDEEHSHLVYPAILHRVHKELTQELGVPELSKQNELAVRNRIDSLRRKKQNPSPFEDPFMTEPCFDEAQDNVFLIYGKPRLPITVQDCFTLVDSQPSIQENCSDELFWQLVFATRRFYEKHGVIPHYGGCPDMESSSEQFRLQKLLYAQKSDQDWAEIAEDLRSHGIDPQEDGEIFQRFRKNVWKVGGLIYRSLKESIKKLPNYFLLYDDQTIRLGLIQELFVAARNYLKKYNEIPLNNEDSANKLLEEMKLLSADLQKDENFQLPQQFIDERPLFVKEFCRYKGEVFPSVVASFTALLAQEITKIIIKQANPVPGIVIYDAVHEFLNVAE